MPRRFTDLKIHRYPLSKVVQLLAAKHLATLIPVSRTGVILNNVNPGFCKTELSRHLPPEIRQPMIENHEKYGRTAEHGSRTLLHGAVAGEKSHGKYLDACEINE
jgi:NAD(P)-dependent dehydrogenase (short-subunit alcohol dehydrogenase family)